MDEAFCLLMMALPGCSSFILEIVQDMRERCKGSTKNMEKLEQALQFSTRQWEPYTTHKMLEKGRDLFRLAKLCPEEVLGARLYTVRQCACLQLCALI